MDVLYILSKIPIPFPKYEVAKMPPHTFIHLSTSGG